MAGSQLTPVQWAFPNPFPRAGDTRSSSAGDSVLTRADPDRDRYSPETLLTLWERVKALGRYHTEHGQYPGGFSLPGLSKTAVMIRELRAASDPPENLSDFMSEQDIKHRLDEKLTKGLQAVLPQISQYSLDDSQDIPKEPTHKTRNVAKELRDDSRDVQKNRAPRTVEWGNNIEVTPIATGSAPSYSAPGTSQRQEVPRSYLTNPALVVLEAATEMRKAMEDNDESDDEALIKMEVDPPLKISGIMGAADAPIDLTSDSNSDKENDS